MRNAIVALLLVGCGSKVDPENMAICEKAYERYTKCVGELLGPDSKKLVSSPGKDGRKQCAADQRTVDAYKKCLPLEGCTKFMDCTMDIAMAEP